jgi:hypothetical protein
MAKTKPTAKPPEKASQKNLLQEPEPQKPETKQSPEENLRRWSVLHDRMTPEASSQVLTISRERLQQLETLALRFGSLTHLAGAASAAASPGADGCRLDSLSNFLTDLSHELNELQEAIRDQAGFTAREDLHET